VNCVILRPKAEESEILRYVQDDKCYAQDDCELCHSEAEGRRILELVTIKRRSFVRLRRTQDDNVFILWKLK
jgi:hypothetical protein